MDKNVRALKINVNHRGQMEIDGCPEFSGMECLKCHYRRGGGTGADCATSGRHNNYILPTENDTHMLCAHPSFQAPPPPPPPKPTCREVVVALERGLRAIRTGEDVEDHWNNMMENMAHEALAREDGE